MRVLGLGMIMVLAGAGAGWACPDAGQSREVMGYAAGALAQVQTHMVAAGGASDLSACDLGAIGLGRFDAAPGHSFVLEGAVTQPVVLAVTSPCDTAMLVRGADGQWRFNDDGNGDLDPRVTLAAEVAAAGKVDVWIGSLDSAGCTAELAVAQAGAAMPIVPFAAPRAMGDVVQAQATQPAPLPMPVPVPAPIPAPVPVPVPVPMPMPTAAVCPDPALIGPSLSVTGPQLLQPQAYMAQIAGENDISTCPDIDGYGMMTQAPSFTLTLSQMAGYAFTAETFADCDAVMAINDANGQWHFNDDGPNGLQPQLILEGAQAEGRVDIWVGSFGGESCQGTIVFKTEVASMPSLPGAGLQGCPNPALQGMPVTTTGAALFTPTTYDVAAGGVQDVSLCGLPVYAAGFFSAQPNLTFTLSGMQDYARLEIQAQSNCDSVMLVRTTDGSWYFDDDGNGNLDPRLELTNTAMLNGRLDIWMGSFGGSAPCQASIEMETWNN